MVRAKQNGPPTNRQTFLQDYARCHQNNTNSVISTAQHRHLILTYYVLRQTHTTNSFVIAHYANRPHNPPNITHVVQLEKTGSDNQNESRKTFHTETAPGAICSHQIQLIVRWLNPVSPPFDSGSGEVAVETLEMVSPFLPSCQPRSSPNLRFPPSGLRATPIAPMMTITGSRDYPAVAMLSFWGALSPHFQK